MLTEVTNVRQPEGEPRRRWFSSSTLDLFLWYDEKDNVIQFQICYDRGRDERALTWHHERGLTHHDVDDGENRTFRMKGTPILVRGSDFDTGRIIREFEQQADNVEYRTVQFILSRINANGDHEKDE